MDTGAWWATVRGPRITVHSLVRHDTITTAAATLRYPLGLSENRARQGSFLGWAQFSSVQSLSCVRLFLIPWTTAHQASLSITNSQSLPKLMSIELVMASSNLILCCPLLLLPSIFPSIRVFLSESSLHIRWPK